MKTYQITHYENDGLNNSYNHGKYEFNNIDEAAEFMRAEYLTMSSDNELILEDGDERSYTLGFNMFSAKELLAANPEIKDISEFDDEWPTEYYTIEEVN